MTKTTPIPPKNILKNEIRKQRRLEVIRVCFCICQVLNVIGYITNSMGVESIFAFVSRSYIILNIVPFVLYFFDSKEMGLEVYFLIFMGLSTVLAYLLHGYGISLYEFLLLLCNYLALPMYFLFLKDLPFDETIHRVVKTTAIIASLFFCVRFFTDPQYTLSNDLTLGYFNANYLAILLIQNMSLLMVLKSLERGGFMRVMLWIFFLFEGYMVLLTHSRAALLCAIVLFLFSFKSKKNVSKGFTNWAILLPLLFILFLTYFGGKGLLSDTQLFGKPLLSGRERMFQNAVTVLLARYPIFGYFHDYQLGNAHNAFLSVLTSTGVFGFLFFFFFYYFSIHKLREKLNGNATRYLAFLGILLLFLEGCAESPGLTAGSMYAAATSPLLLFIKYGEDTEKPKEDKPG